MAAFASKSVRTVAGEISDLISAVGTKQTRSLSAIIGIDFTTLTFPPWQTIAFVAALLKSHASSAVVARISTGCTRIYLYKDVKRNKIRYVN